MSELDEFKNALIDNLAHLRAFAHMLARNHALAEDLVQDTVVQALANRSQFRPGTNLRGWLIIILRNRFFNEMRRSSRKAEVTIEDRADRSAVDGGQEARVELSDFNKAFWGLPPAQREALVLVGASGFSYEEAAAIAGCPVGTMKSRVSRARLDLQQRLHGTETPEAWIAVKARRAAAIDRRVIDPQRHTEAGAVSPRGEASAARAGRR